jgi:hypothetical protein
MINMRAAAVKIATVMISVPVASIAVEATAIAEAHYWSAYACICPASRDPVAAGIISGHPFISRTRAGRLVRHRGAHINAELCCFGLC